MADNDNELPPALPAAPEVYRFGPFTFVPSSGLLHRGEREILLPLRASGVLAALLSRAGEVISKDELLAGVWQDACVGEHSLTQAVSALREALDDDPRAPTYIQTLPRRGYRFTAVVTAAPDTNTRVKGAPTAAVQPGDTLGGYEILEMLGAGGAGVVYRARDNALDRDVALKVLRAGVVADETQLARLEHEARLLASVSHPGIATVHGLEDCRGVRFIAMEAVEGETLAERLQRGPLPVELALRVASRIARALEAAHAKGIIHRDLKPANVKLTAGDEVKVLDFGLAAAFPVPQPAVESSPSPTTEPVAAGVELLGSVAYMSPEQTRDQPLDQRADVWAFGCVLFEMLTGRRAFEGADVADTLAKILRDEPAWSLLPAATPLPLRMLLRRCLQRNPDLRLHDIADARIEVDELLTGEPQSVAPTAEGQEALEARRPGSRWRLAALMSGVAVIAALLATNALRVRGPTGPPVRFEVSWPPDALGSENDTMFSLSPDGSLLALADEGRLWLRALDSLEVRSIDVPAGAVRYPFWSPDSEWLGFFSEDRLQKVSLSTGLVQSICEAQSGRGGSWSGGGTIIFGTMAGGLMQVSEHGGTPKPLTRLPAEAAGGDAHRYPHFLPDGVHFLYLHLAADPDLAGVYVGALDGSPPRRLLRGASRASFTPAAPRGSVGHLVFKQERVLVAQRFDVDRLELQGGPFPLADDVGFAANTAYEAFAVADNGTLAFTSSISQVRELVWRSRSGERLGPASAMRVGDQVALSPDERKLLLVIESRPWLQEVAGADPHPLDAGVWFMPAWSPDGREVALASWALAGLAGYEIGRRAIDLSGEVQTVVHDDVLLIPWHWSPDGTGILFSRGWFTRGEAGPDLYLARLGGEAEPVALVSGPGTQTMGQFSPDARWLAYASDERGESQVYVQPFPPTGATWQASTRGASMPRWRADGRELYFRAADGRLVARTLAAGGSEDGTAGPFDSERPLTLFDDLPASRSGIPFFTYEPAANGTRFLVSEPVAGALPPIRVVLNWQAEFDR